MAKKSSQIQLVSGFIRPGNDRNTRVYRHAGRPMTWPEVQLLRHIHGDAEAVEVEAHVGYVERTAKDERERLSLTYGREHANQVFPGASPVMEMEGDEVRIEDAKPKNKGGRPKKDETPETPDETPETSETTEAEG